MNGRETRVRVVFLVGRIRPAGETAMSQVIPMAPRRPTGGERDDRLSRGVFFTPYGGPRGERYLIAINHRGERILEATLFAGVPSRSVERILWQLLDRDDPPALAPRGGAR